ncbi:MAG: ATP-dependent metallopeptidase FtsH/Yme1/Tma family protein, partial [Roseibium sp.]
MGNLRNIVFWVGLFFLILALFNMFSGTGSTMQSREMSYSDFVAAVDAGDVTRATLDGEQVRFERSDGQSYVAIKPQDAEITQLLTQADITL